MAFEAQLGRSCPGSVTAATDSPTHASHYIGKLLEHLATHPDQERPPTTVDGSGSAIEHAAFFATNVPGQLS